MQLTVLALLSFTISNYVYSKFIYRIATIEQETNRSAFSIPRAGAAIDMALEKIANTYEHLNITHTVRFAPGGPTQAGAVAAELHCHTGVDAFIGPGSSTAVEAMGHLVTSWNMPFVTPVGGLGSLGNRELYPTLIRMSTIAMESFALFLLEVLDVYSWRHLVVLHDKHSFSRLHWESISALLALHPRFVWTHYELDHYTFTDLQYQRVLREANKYARVYTEKKDARRLMLLARELGYTEGEHVMLVTIRRETSIDKTYWQTGDDEDEAAKQAFQSGLFFTMTSPYNENFAEFEDEVKLRSRRDYGFDYGDEQVSFHASSYYDSFTMFARVLNESLAEGGDPQDGREMAHRMLNRTFPGVSSDFRINAGGRRDSKLSLHQIDPDTGIFRVVVTYEGDGQQYLPIPGMEIYWPGGSPPADIPLCGFRNDLCPATGAVSTTSIAVYVCFATIIGVSVSVGAIFLRRWKKRSEADMWWWKIEEEDITFMDSKKTGSCFTSCASRLSTLTSRSKAPNVEKAFVKGHIVRVRRLSLSLSPPNKNLLNEFKKLRDLNQVNIARVTGACLGGSLQCVFTEDCSKGTLQDLLGDSRITLDPSFKFSLCIDIAQGMCYLHSSPVHVHGRLTSATCLVDNRFSVKLSDVGLPSIYHNLQVDQHSQEYKIGSLWKAPEVLRGEVGDSTHSGDVYSFGIVLQEVVSREAPFFQETELLDLATILDNVRSGERPYFRPKVETSGKLQGLKTLMESCWVEKPQRRPNFIAIRRRLKTLAFQCGASGDLLDNLLNRMEQYANNLETMVEAKTVELREEKKKSEELLYQILPRSVAERLRQGLVVDPEAYSCVTIYFSDICGFTNLSAQSTPFQVVDLLNDLYTCFDAVIDAFDVYKVETIGDAYMVVSGLPQRNGNRHAFEIARMSLALLKAIETFTIRHLPDEILKLRIGLHSGPVVAGVVGMKMPRYCLFGDTVNTASRMESHGRELKIHTSHDTADLLRATNSFNLQSRGLTDIKGKGQMETYWVLGSID